MKTEEKFTPRLSDFSSWLIPAFSLVLTRKIPITDRNTPTAAISIGAKTALSCIPPWPMKALAPRAAVARTLPQYDS